jgi:eukaryotic-like serine/threonine-protein kinase
MAPEQLVGGTPDRRVDVYACGVLLWEALVGRKLFAAYSDVAVIAGVLSDPIEPPSKFEPGAAALDGVVLRALERDPEKRFASARDMALALEQAVRFAPASTIGEWVETLACDALAKRAALVARIERATMDAGTGPRLQAPPETQPVRLAPHLGVAVSPDATPTASFVASATADFDALSQPSHPSGGDEPTPIMLTRDAPAPLSWRHGGLRRHGTTAVVVCGFAAMLAYWMDITGRRSVVEAQAAESAPRVVVVPEESELALTAAQAETEPAIDPPLAPGARGWDPAPTEAAMHPPARVTPMPAATARHARPRATAGPCSPPYTFDASGTKRYKVECL